MSDARVIVVSVDELDRIVEAAVRRVLADRARPVEWLDVDAVAGLLGVHRRTVLKRIKSGEIPASRIGKLYRVQRADLDAYLAGV